MELNLAALAADGPRRSRETGFAHSSANDLTSATVAIKYMHTRQGSSLLRMLRCVGCAFLIPCRAAELPESKEVQVVGYCQLPADCLAHCL
jgi:hypothetical protein